MLIGGCQCGGVRYAHDGDALALFVCHCRECRRQSASAFGLSLLAPRAGFRITQGRPLMWSRRADSGRTLDCFFCPDCGARLWHEADGADTIAIKAGSLDDPVDLSGAIHIWTKRKLPGVVIPPGAQQFPEEPA
jgi:hypothetical protein